LTPLIVTGPSATRRPKGISALAAVVAVTLGVVVSLVVPDRFANANTCDKEMTMIHTIIFVTEFLVIRFSLLNEARQLVTV
jgi:hypothetical protein